MGTSVTTPSAAGGAAVPISTTGGTYFGRTTTGRGQAIPVSPVTGQIDINALIGQMVDRRKTYCYDTLKLAPGAVVQTAPYRFFQTQIGQGDPYNGGQVKTELETNMRSSGMFNPPYDFIVNNLGFLFLPQDDLFDIEQIMQHGWFEFKILEKTMWMGHLWRHPPGAGLVGFSTKTSESVWNNGNPEPGSIWYFGDFKKYIPPMVNFSLTLTFPETYSQIYGATLPASITSVLGSGIGSSYPTLSGLAAGGNGIQLIAFMNGLSDGPVQ
jgi:hypothetical protein